MDLFVSSRTKNFSGNYCSLVIVIDYSRYTWTFFLFNKREPFVAFHKLAKVIQNEKGLSITSI